MDDGYISKLAQGLVNCGVKYAFGVTGSGLSLRLISSLEERGIPYYPVAHEASAVLMAGACCRDGKLRAVAIGTKGPGFINFLPGILSNYYEGRPALTISEAYGPSTPSYFKHKRLDHRLLCSSIVKGSATVDGSPETLQQLLDLAEKEFPGPIHLDLCKESVTDIKMPVEQDSSSRSLSESEIDKLAGYITNSRCPAILLGSMVSRKLKAVAWDRLNVPVLTTPAAKGCIDENMGYCGGVVTGEGKEVSPENMIVEKADLIIAIGLRNTELVKVKPFSAPLIIIDVIDGDIHAGFEPVACFIASDMASVVELVVSKLSNKRWGEDIIDAYRRSIHRELFSDHWMPPVVFQQVQQVLNGAVLVIDTGLFCAMGEIVWRARTYDDFCGSSIGRFMGTALPTAIGVAISNPQKNVTCVFGDGGIRPYISEIKLAVEHNLSILFLLISEGRYGTVAMSAKSSEFSRRAFTIKDPSWWRTVESMGCPSMCVSNIDELNSALGQWLKNKGSLFLETRFDPQKYCNLTKRVR